MKQQNSDMEITLFGCKIHNLNMQETLDKIEQFIVSKRAHQHVVVNVDKIVKAHRDEGIRQIINNCDLVSVDGMPVVWASKLLGQPIKQRVAGIDLFHALVAHAAKMGWRVYFLGAQQKVVEKVVQSMSAEFPALKVAGYRNGYWSDGEEAGLVALIKAHRPDIIFVAMSSPKKELFLAKYQAQMQVPFAMGVGGTFDVVAGIVKRAPRWMQVSGFEWLYRFMQEPRRMFHRYFVEDMYFFVLLAREWAKLRQLRRAKGLR